MGRMKEQFARVTTENVLWVHWGKEKKGSRQKRMNVTRRERVVVIQHENSENEPAVSKAGDGIGKIRP